MKLQCFPDDLLNAFLQERGNYINDQKTTEVLWKDLGGNAFTGSVIAALIMAILMNVPDCYLKKDENNEGPTTDDELDMVF
eukprot:4191633-Pyramimonas_sp.AAC.1